MSNPSDYVPSELIVRATINSPNDVTLAGCPEQPWTADALLHVAECGSCQAMLDADAASLGGYEDALAYLPSESLIGRVILASARPRYRVRLLDDLTVARPSPRSFRRRAAALLATMALQPAVLAAAVVAHVAIASWLAGLTVFSISAPQSRGVVQVEYVPLDAYRAPARDERLERGVEQRAFASGVAHAMAVASVLSGLSNAELKTLDSTVAILRRNRRAHVLIGAESARDALSAAEVIGRYLIVRGATRAQVRIVASGANVGRVRVALDTLESAP